MSVRGPSEYILFVQNGSEAKEIDCETYEKIHQILIANRIPQIFHNETSCNFFSDEESLLQERIKHEGCDSINLVSIPRTLYELFYIKTYLESRFRTSFVTFNSEQEAFDENFIFGSRKPFMFDHKLSKATLDLPSLYQNGIDYMKNDYVAFLTFELNNAIFASMIANGWRPDSNDSDWVFRILSQLTSFLESLQYEKDTEISKEYDCWPIRKSEEIYEKWVWLNGREDDVTLEDRVFVESTYLELFKEIFELKIKLKQCIKNKDILPFAEPFSIFLNCINEDNLVNTLKLNIIEAFWPILIQEKTSLLNLQFQPNVEGSNTPTAQLIFTESETQEWLLKIKRYLDPYHRIDVCVSCFRRRGYVKHDLIAKVIKMEMEQTSDTLFLFRGTVGPEIDSPVLMENYFNQFIKKKSNSLVNPLKAHSLSYGFSFFAGIFYDKTATAYNSIIKKKHWGYIIRIPVSEFFTEKFSNLFFIPPTPSFVHLVSIGEMFHPRTKVYLENQNDPQLFVSGIHQCSYRAVPSFLRATKPQTYDNFQKVFQDYSCIIKPK